jgi:hypothetical protein
MLLALMRLSISLRNNRIPPQRPSRTWGYSRSDESPNFIAREVLGLTKINRNNTQFDGKYPVTLGCARKVGEVMKYLENDRPQIRYGFYM